MKLSRSILAFFLAITAANHCLAQTSFGWNFGTTAASTASNTGAFAPFTVSNMMYANSFGNITTNPISNSVSSGYTGASGQFNFGQAVNNAVTSLTGNTETAPYYSFTVTPPTTAQVQITSVSFGERSTATGAKQFSLRSNIDNYGSSIFSGTLLNDSTWRLINSGTLSFPPSGAIDTAVTFRLYVFDGASNASSGTINTRIDDFTVTFVTPVPEPATVLGIAAIGAFAACRIRRRFAKSA